MSLKKYASTIVFAACLALQAIPAVQAEQAVYTVTGNINGGAPLTFGLDDIANIGETEIKTSIFVMGDAQHTVKGVLMRDLMRHVGGKGQNAKIAALDGYTMDVPVEDFLKYDVVLATEIDGKKLTVRDKGPAWLIYPASANPELKDTIYESRSVWQIKTIEFN
jgi:hypothetical protein